MYLPVIPDAVHSNFFAKLFSIGIRTVLVSNEVDFDLGSVIEIKSVVEKRRDGMPEHYTVFIDTGNSLVESNGPAGV